MSFKTKLKEIIDTLKQGHCTGTLSKTKFGRATSPMDSEAVAWCLLGACAKVHNVNRTFHSFESIDFIEFLSKETGHERLGIWNDTNPDQVIPTLERLYDEL